MELLEYKRNGFIKKVKISTSGKDNACENCLKLEGKTFTINKALEKMPFQIRIALISFMMKIEVFVDVAILQRWVALKMLQIRYYGR